MMASIPPGPAELVSFENPRKSATFCPSATYLWQNEELGSRAMKQAVAHIEPEVRGLRLLVAADTDEVIARSCDRKRAYGARCARLVAQRRRGTGEQVSPYRCFYCGAWHVG